MTATDTGEPVTGAVSPPARRPRHLLRQRWWAWGVMALVVALTVGSAARTPPTDGVSEERVYALAVQLKCLQCVGESVAASQAQFAVKFRDEIRAQMRRGSTDDEILNFFAARYGQEVLLRPPSTGLAGLIWIIPVVAAAAAAIGLVLVFRRWRHERDETAPASAEDAALVDAALRRRRDPSP
jgi:cytochrome c-type biogenesis protein CcmH